MYMTRRIVFVSILGLLILATWWLLRAGGEGAKVREALNVVPGRIANLSVPMSIAWDADYRFPESNVELDRYGTPVGALGAQADGTILNVTADGVVQVTIVAPGNDQRAGRLSYLPLVDLNALPPMTRVHEWRCLSDNLPSIAQLLPGCTYVMADQLGTALAQHRQQLASAAAALQPAEPEPETVPEPLPESAVPFPPAGPAADAPMETAPGTDALPQGPAISLTPEEVDRALKSGQSLEQALADKRRLLVPQ